MDASAEWERLANYFVAWCCLFLILLNWWFLLIHLPHWWFCCIFLDLWRREDARDADRIWLQLMLLSPAEDDDNILHLHRQDRIYHSASIFGTPSEQCIVLNLFSLLHHSAVVAVEGCCWTRGGICWKSNTTTTGQHLLSMCPITCVCTQKSILCLQCELLYVCLYGTRRW